MNEHSIKSEQYFGVAWENATPEQKQLIWDALSQADNKKENTMNNIDTPCEAITKKGTQHTTSNATHNIEGIRVCGIPAHIEWAKEEYKRRMNEMKKDWDADLAPTDKEIEMNQTPKSETTDKKEKIMTESMRAMLRGAYKAAKNNGYPEHWLNRIIEIEEQDDVMAGLKAINTLKKKPYNLIIRPIYKN